MTTRPSSRRAPPGTGFLPRHSPTALACFDPVSATTLPRGDGDHCMCSRPRIHCPRCIPRPAAGSTRRVSKWAASGTRCSAPRIQPASGSPSPARRSRDTCSTSATGDRAGGSFRTARPAIPRARTSRTKRCLGPPGSSMPIVSRVGRLRVADAGRSGTFSPRPIGGVEARSPWMNAALSPSGRRTGAAPRSAGSRPGTMCRSSTCRRRRRPSA